MARQVLSKICSTLWSIFGFFNMVWIMSAADLHTPHLDTSAENIGLHLRFSPFRCPQKGRKKINHPNKFKRWYIRMPVIYLPLTNSSGCCCLLHNFKYEQIWLGTIASSSRMIIASAYLSTKSLHDCLTVPGINLQTS